MTTQTLKQFILKNYADNIPDIANYGCEGGVSGMIYYEETVALYDRFHDCIWETLSNLAEDLGENVLKMISECNYAKQVYNDKTFKNYMVWFAVESICHDIMMEKDNEQEGGAE